MDQPTKSTDILALIGDDKAMISYRPSWNNLTGSVNATIFLQQVLYRWLNQGRVPFYKFSAPCKHRYYRAGDSWQEELGFTRRELENARRRVSILTRGNLLPTQLISYWYDIGRKTWYALNEPLLLDKLATIYPPQAAQPATALQTTLALPESDIAISKTTIAAATTAALTWMGFDGRLTKKEKETIPLEMIVSWGLWIKIDGKELLRKNGNPVGVARNNWREGEWPSELYQRYAPYVAADLLASSDETEMHQMLDAGVTSYSNYGAVFFNRYLEIRELEMRDYEEE